MYYADRMNHTPKSFIREILKVTDSPDVISFAGGLPNPETFPVKELQKAADDAIMQHGSRLFQYASTEGHMPLREYIAQRYQTKYGLSFDGEDILLTNGSQQALDLLSKALLNQGDCVVVEEPGYLGAIQALSIYEPTFLPVPLKEDGLDIEALGKTLQEHPVKLIYTVPNFHNPTGRTYSRENRQAILDLLSGTDIVLVEDDPYGELRFTGEFLPYIGGGKLKNSVLLGSFSKTVAPGIRLGYLATKNKELMQQLITCKQASDLHTSIFTQYMMYTYLVENRYDDHIKTIIDRYSAQANAMLDAMQAYFPSQVQYTKPQGGMFVWVTLEEGRSALQLFPKAMEQKVAFVPGDPFYVEKTDVNAMRLNFTNASPEVIKEGIKRLGQILA